MVSFVTISLTNPSAAKEKTDMNRKLLLTCLFTFIVGATFSQTPFTPGSLAVLRVGDGTTTLGTAALPVFIDEYSTSGKLIRSIALPTAPAGKNKRLTLDGNTPGVSSYEGLLSLSQDAKKLSLAGYDAAVGTDAVVASESDQNNRVIGVIDGAGKVNTSTALNIYSKVYISSAVADGNNVWVAGGNANIYTTTIGSTDATSIIGRSGRSIRIFKDQLYVSQSSGLAGPLVTIGTGLPTTAAQKAVAVPNLTINGTSPTGREFFFADVNPNIPGNDVLYIANSGITDGITKYSLVDGTWVTNGTVKGQYAGLTATVSGNEVTVYGIKYGATSSELFKITDNTGYNGSISALTRSVLAKTGANMVFRGLSLSPQNP